MVDVDVVDHARCYTSRGIGSPGEQPQAAFSRKEFLVSAPSCQFFRTLPYFAFKELQQILAVFKLWNLHVLV